MNAHDCREPSGVLNLSAPDHFTDRRVSMRNRFVAAAISTAMLASLPTAAFAGDRDNARVAIAGAKAKIDMNEKNGLTGEAADVQARARVALDKAQHEFHKSNEDTAKASATEASALADLASSTQQKQLIEQQTAAVQPN
jgi:hypothetical protein